MIATSSGITVWGLGTPYAKRKLKHFMVKKFVPVFDRTEERWVLNKSMNSRSGYQELPKYTRWEYNFWKISRTSIPKQLWAIARARRKKIGQLILWSR